MTTKYTKDTKKKGKRTREWKDMLCPLEIGNRFEKRRIIAFLLSMPLSMFQLPGKTLHAKARRRKGKSKSWEENEMARVVLKIAKCFSVCFAP